MKYILPTLAILLLTLVHAVHAADAPGSPKQVWADYDPNKGDFKEEIISKEIKDGILTRDFYISAYVLNEEIRVYCKYSVKEGVTNAPGLLNVRGWMSWPIINTPYVKDGWACLSFDYCGKTPERLPERQHYTKYPERFRHGNHVGPNIHDKTPDGKSITDPKQTSEYLWYAIERRALSYLEQQKEVDKTRLAAIGSSVGGTLMWSLGTDPRIKAIVAHYGIGYLEYYRNKSVWLYNNPYVEPAKTPGEELFLATMAPEAYVPYITAPTLYLNGSNDHHGGHERGLESFKRFKKDVPWAFAIQARGHHNTDKIDQDEKMWLEKYVLKKDVFWPAHPTSSIRLNAEGVPELIVTPSSPDKVKKVEMFYALKEPCSFIRSWYDAEFVRKGDSWIGKMPVVNVNDYVFGFANINYDTTVVLSTDFNAAIPSKLGSAKATAKPSVIFSGDGGLGAWSNVAEVEGVGDIQGFRCTDNKVGVRAELASNPKWKAPLKAQLGFKFYCTQPQTLIFSAGDHDVEIEITASDNWQEMLIPSRKLINRINRKPMADWKSVTTIHLMPKVDADITKVLFAQFKWVVSDKPAVKKN